MTCIVCNSNSAVSSFSDFPIEIIVGPEYLTGSSRMKAGTAQKMVLNMISTCVMIKLGRVFDNKMIDMKLSNNKLYNRAIGILQSILKIDEKQAKKLIDENIISNESLDNSIKTFKNLFSISKSISKEISVPPSCSLKCHVFSR